MVDTAALVVITAILSELRPPVLLLMPGARNRTTNVHPAAHPVQAIDNGLYLLIITAKHRTFQMRFIVIVTMYNMAPWIGNAIQSLKTQTCRDFLCLIGDDLSTDDSAEVAARNIADDPRFILVRHREKKFSMGNIHSLIERSKAETGDIIVLIDGDDRLAHPDVLQRLREIYESHDCWMTYGSYSHDGVTRSAHCTPYPAWIVRRGLFKRCKWRASHLKTFRYALWQRIPRNVFPITQQELDGARRRALLHGRLRSWWHWRKIELETLLDSSLSFPRRCSDKSLTIPMLDLAGKRARFVDDILYIYNQYEKEHDYGRKCAHQRWYNRLIRDILQHKPRLKPLESLHG